MALVPFWWRIAIFAGAMAIAFGFGVAKGIGYEGDKKQLVIEQMQHDFDTRIAAASDALIAANKRADAASQGSGVDHAAIDTAYQKGKTDGAAAAKDRIADFTSGRQRVRVDAICRPDTARGGQLPGAGSAPVGPDAAAGAGVAELRPDAAGRVEAAAEKVKDLARQVVALQALAQSEHDRCNQVSAPPVAPSQPTAAAVATPAGAAPKKELSDEELVRKRRLIRLGLPNPFKD